MSSSKVLIALFLFVLSLPAGFSATDPAVPAASPASTAPAVPLGVAMVANSADSITLAWYRSPNDDAKAYNVYSSATKDGVFTKLATVTERTTPHDKLTAGTT